MPDQHTKDIRFVKDPNYRRIHATGVWGSISPVGELTFELFEDVIGLPEMVKLHFQENGTIQQKNYPEEPEVQRIIHAGISMPIHIVPSVIEWLQGKLREYEELQKQSNQ